MEIKNILLSSGATLVGFANLDKIASPFDKDIKTGISIAVALNPNIINKIIDGPTIEYYEEYKRVNKLLGALGRIAANHLREYGYKAIELEPTPKKIEYIDLGTPLPHKTIATRAGLGWIGKTALLITKKYGSAVRLTSVLTNIKFDGEIKPIDSSKCGNCNICVDDCPGQAANGKEWNTKMNRSDFFDAYLCRDTALERAKKIGVNRLICGKCIVICPWTKKYLKRSYRL